MSALLEFIRTYTSHHHTLQHDTSDMVAYLRPRVHLARKNVLAQALSKELSSLDTTILYLGGSQLFDQQRPDSDIDLWCLGNSISPHIHHCLEETWNTEVDIFYISRDMYNDIKTQQQTGDWTSVLQQEDEDGKNMLGSFLELLALHRLSPPIWHTRDITPHISTIVQPFYDIPDFTIPIQYVLSRIYSNVLQKEPP
ncbi:MAG: hypothetical protein ACMXYC_02055 [Candidatus Woesearchaeota archaeon]